MSVQVQYVDGGEAVHVGGRSRGCMRTLYFHLNFAVNLKLLFKIKKIQCHISGKSLFSNRLQLWILSLLPNYKINLTLGYVRMFKSVFENEE